MAISGARRRLVRRCCNDSLIHVRIDFRAGAADLQGCLQCRQSRGGHAVAWRQLAVEWGPKGVRSNVVSPGLIRTPMTQSIYDAPGVLAARRALVPRRRGIMGVIPRPSFEAHIAS